MVIFHSYVSLPEGIFPMKSPSIHCFSRPAVVGLRCIGQEAIDVLHPKGRFHATEPQQGVVLLGRVDGW